MTKIHPALKIVWNLFLITAGSLLCAVSINGILVPNQFLAGGVSGLSLFIYYLFPFMPVGVTNFLLNIPLFVVGWVFVGRRFFYYSLAGMTVFSLALLAPVPGFPIRDPLLNALTAGIISGVGSGVILKSLGPAAVWIFSRSFCSALFRPHRHHGHGVQLHTDAGLPVRFNLEIVLYTLIYLFVTTQLINLVVTGLNQRKAVMVVSLNGGDRA
jgi:uncharacterized membrane-anchored protein YitT (DUF2179 family)